MTDALEQQVLELIAKKKKVEPDTLSLDTTFEELGLDSLDRVDLLFTFEDTFSLNIPDSVAREMKSIRQVVDSLRAALAAPPTPAAAAPTAGTDGSTPA